MCSEWVTRDAFTSFIDENALILTIQLSRLSGTRMGCGRELEVHIEWIRKRCALEGVPQDARV